MEWCDYLHYFPAAFDGKCSLVPAAMREDVAAIVQLLLVVVQSTRGQLPYTQNEYKKTWEHIFLQIYMCMLTAWLINSTTKKVQAMM